MVPMEHTQRHLCHFKVSMLGTVLLTQTHAHSGMGPWLCESVWACIKMSMLGLFSESAGLEMTASLLACLG